MVRMLMYYIEHDFPIEQLNPLARREANAKRAIAMLHKWWARRVGCVFRTMILASLIPEEEVRVKSTGLCRKLNRTLAKAQRDSDVMRAYDIPGVRR